MGDIANAARKNGQERYPPLDADKNKGRYASKCCSTGLFHKFILESIDTTIFNFLNMLEEHEDRLVLSLTGEEQGKDICRISDGLSGELFGSEGWIEKFSEYK